MAKQYKVTYHSSMWGTAIVEAATFQEATQLAQAKLVGTKSSDEILWDNPCDGELDIDEIVEVEEVNLS